MKNPKDLNPEESGARQKIIDAATELFAQEGLHGISTRDIAKASGLNVSLISYYFGGKENLYKTVIQGFFHRVYGELEKVIDEFEKDEVSEKSLRRALLSLVNTLVDLRSTDPLMAKILTREKISGMPFSRDIHESMMRNGGIKLESIIARGQEAGLVNKKINPRFVLICLVESVTGYFNMLDCNCSWNGGIYSMPEQKNEFTNQITMIFLEGILK